MDSKQAIPTFSSTSFFKDFKMNKLIINIFNQDVDAITDLIEAGFNVTKFERIHLGVGKTALLVSVNGLDGVGLSVVEYGKIKNALYTYYARNPREIIYQLPNQRVVRRVENWGLVLDERKIRKPYRGKINAGVCRYAVINAQILAQCKRIVKARKLATNIAKDCLKISTTGGNKRKFNVDFDKVDKDTLFACLHRLDYELTQEKKGKLIVSW